MINRLLTKAELKEKRIRFRKEPDDDDDGDDYDDERTCLWQLI